MSKKVRQHLKIVPSSSPDDTDLPWENLPQWVQPFIESLLTTMRLKDPDTYGHLKRVAAGSREFAEVLGLNPFEQRIAEYSGLFHDIGKIGIPDSILLKADRLTEKEDKIMRTHAVKSVEVILPLTHIPFFAALIPGIRYHHERWDGNGYPEKLKGEEIPLMARIVSFADTFDAITSSRIYREGRPPEVAYSEIERCAGTQFDPELAKRYLAFHPIAHKKRKAA